MFYICHSFLHIDERQHDQTGDEIKDQSQNTVAQTSKNLVGKPEDQRTCPRSAAFADFIERIEFGFFPDRDHLRKEAAADGLRSAHDQSDEDAQNEELSRAAIAFESAVRVDHNARPNDQTDNDRLLGTDPLGKFAPEECAAECDKLDHKNDSDQRVLG